MTSSLLKIAAGGAAVLLATKLFSYGSLAANIVTRVSDFRVINLDLQGLTLGVKAQIRNPTTSSVTISQPFVVLTTRGNQLAESNPTNGTVRILAQNTTVLPEIQIHIPLTAALGLFGSNVTVSTIIAAYKTGFKNGSAELLRQLKVPLEVAVSFYADGLFVKVPPQNVIY